MVYDQNGERWIFFHDLFGQWQWTHVDGAGATVAQAERSSRTFCICMRDARRHGFRVRRTCTTRVSS